MTSFTLCAARSCGNANNNHCPNHHQITDEHTTLLEKYYRLLDQISDLDNRQAAYHHYREELDKLDADHIEFTPSLWHTLVDHAEIGTDGTITFTFRDGRSQAISLNK